MLGGLAGYYEDLADCSTNYFHYLGALHQAGAWDAFDVIAIHPYRVGSDGHGYAPEDPIGRGLAYSPALHACQSGEEATHSLISEVRAVAELGEMWGEKPIWITEIGWQDPWLQRRANERGTTSEVVEADYVVRTYVPLLAEASVEKVFWYTQLDQNVQGFELDGAGRQALGNLSALLAGGRSLGQIQGMEDRGRPDDDDVYEYRFAKDDQIVVVLWKARGGDTPRSVTVGDLDADTVRAYSATAASLSPEAGRVYPVHDRSVTLDLTERPILLIIESSSPLESLPQKFRSWWEEWSEARKQDAEKWWEDWSEARKQDAESWWEETKRDLETRFEEWIAEQEEKVMEEIERQASELCGGVAISWVLIGGLVIGIRQRGRPRQG